MSGQMIGHADLPDEARSIVLYDWMSEDMKDVTTLEFTK
jgi:hypothetical protein